MMKKGCSGLSVRMVALCLALLMAVLPLVACTAEGSDTGTGEESVSESEALPQALPVDFLAAETVPLVRPELVGDDLLNAFLSLYGSLQELSPGKFKPLGDFVLPGQDVTGYEILIGDVDRVETAEIMPTLRAKDYIIAVSGKKLIIAGGTEESTITAINYFMQRLMLDTMVYESGELFRYTAKYAVNELNLFARPITDYRIVYSGADPSGETVANAIAAAIREESGYVLKVVRDLAGERDCEIVIGKTVRDNTETTLDLLEYTVRSEGTRIFLRGGSQRTMIEAGMALLSKFATGELSAAGSISLSETFDYGDEGFYEVLAGKSMLAIGDSYFGGSGLDKQTEVWPALLSIKYNMYFKNYGIGGSTISNYTSEHNPMVDRISAMEAGDPDIVLLQGGRNDYGREFPIGTNEDTTGATFKGAIKLCIEQLHRKYPNALIICITNWKFAGSRAYGDCYTYANAMEEIAGLYEYARCVNATDTTKIPVDMGDASFRAAYCKEPNDVSHLNLKGMQYVMPYFEKQIAAIYKEYLDSKAAA